jgi:arylsulfatase A-like enzyme
VDNRLLEAIDLAPTMLTIIGAAIPEKMQGEPFLGPNTGPPKEYVFGARDRCDMTVFRLRTVRDKRFRYIRNFTPARPFLQYNEYKDKQYPAWTLLPKLYAEGKLTPVQSVLCAPTMPVEELYDLDSDPHQTNNLASSVSHESTLQRLSGILERWIEETGDQGREFEPEQLVKAQGVTKPDTQPSRGYILEDAAHEQPIKPVSAP